MAINKDLEEILNNRDIPDLDDQARRRILDSATSQYRMAGQRADVPAEQTGWFTLHWKRLAYYACVSALAIGLPWVVHLQQVTGEVQSLRQEVALLREYQSLFADELKAVVLAPQSDVQLVLGANSAQPSNPAVLVTFTKGSQETRLIAVSGQTLSFTLAGKEVSLDMLITANGRVLLVGEEGVWQQGASRGLLNHDIHAEVLEEEV